MHPDIEKLLEIQEIDCEILELKEQIGSYPGVWNELKNSLREKTRAREQAEAGVHNHEHERRRIEKELRDCMERLKRYQAQQMLVKTSKELMSVNTQIEGVKRKIASYQEAGEELLHKDEDVKKAVETAGEKLAGAKQLARGERERIRGQVARKKDRIASLEQDRSKLTPQLSDHIVRLYDTTWKRQPGSPIVPVHNGSCSGCHFAVLPNKLVIVHQGLEIVRCDHCGRMLSHDPEREESEVGAEA